MNTIKSYIVFCALLCALILNFSCTDNNQKKNKQIEINKADKIMKRLKYLHYENNEGEKGITTFYCNSNGVNDKARWELLDKSRWSDNFHTYGEHGNLIRKYREFSDGMTSDLIYVYDENNNLVKEEFSRSDNVHGETYYKYENNLRVGAICKYMYGWFHGKIRYKYEDNILTSAVLEKDNAKIGFITYAYDADGDLITEFWHFESGFTQTFRYEFEEY